MKRTLFFCLLFLMSSFLEAQEPIWPTDASRVLSSNFGEFRSSNFHMGIDIKTNGSEGYPVFAVTDGYISRMVTNFSGYGKALYLTTDSGYTAVYGHLSKFSPTLEEILKSYQKSNQSYFVDQYFSDTEFIYKKGDILGYTGNTGGSSGPHLHFEYRNSNEQPLNPFSHGFTLSDRRSPVIYKVAIIPFSAEAMINANPLPQIFPLFQDRTGQYNFPDTLNCAGTIGLAILANDKIQGVPNKYQYYQVELWVDRVLHFSIKYDSLDYNLSQAVHVAKNYRLSRLNLGEFQNLYHFDSHPLLTIYNGGENGLIHLKPGYHLVEIKVRDFAGNQSVVKGVIFTSPPAQLDVREISRSSREITFNIRPAFGAIPIESVVCYSFTPYGFPDEKIEQLKLERVGKNLHIQLPLKKVKKHILQFIGTNKMGSYSYPFHWAGTTKPHDILDLSLDLEFTHIEKGLFLQIQTGAYSETSLAVRLEGENSFTHIPLRQIQPTVFLSSLLSPSLFNDVRKINILLENQLEREVHFEFVPGLATPEKLTTVLSRDQLCSIRTTKNSVYDSTLLWIDVVEKSAPVKNGRPLSKVYQLQPYEIPLKNSIQIGIRYDGRFVTEEGLGIYYYDQKEEEWSYLPTENHHNRRVLTASISSLEAVTIIQDTVPPSVKSTFPAPGGNYNHQDLVFLRAFLEDDLSGIDIDEANLTMTLDGKKLFAAYQPVKKELSYRLDASLARGSHELVISVKDYAGHITIKSVNFSVN